MRSNQQRLPDVNHEDIDDETLARLAGQEPHVFAGLYHRYLDRIYHYHLVRTGSVEDAQDLTSQTFLAALEHIDAYRGQSSFCRWLFSIAGHKLVDYYRRRRPAVPLDSAESWQDPADLPEDVAIAHVRLAQIAAALAALLPIPLPGFIFFSISSSKPKSG